MRILVVEDEPAVAAFLKKGLEEEAYTVDTAATGPEGEEAARRGPYDLILLDLMLPGKDGVEVCRGLRQSGLDTPILMLTARTSSQDKVTGLDGGADDYLTKPFSFDELLARVRALGRRRPSIEAEPLRVGSLVLDRMARRARRGDRETSLTNREFSLLEFLMRRRGQVVSRSVLAEHVWGESLGLESNVVDVTIRRLRSKLDTDPGHPIIHTVRGSGYMVREEAEV